MIPSKSGNIKKKRSPIAPKIKANLQKEIKSKCPFCPSEDVGHFEVHHIDENPSNNEFGNLLMLCPTCHSKITKKEITVEKVLHVKQLLIAPGDISYAKLISFEISQTDFKKELIRLFEDKKSLFYSEVKSHWNTYSLIESSPLLNLLINRNLISCINNGMLHLISDFVSRHIQYDRDSKYLYNQKHVYAHDSEDEGFDLPLYFYIKFIGLLYTTSVYKKSDIGNLSNRYSNMQTIYSDMIRLMCMNLDVSTVDLNSEYPTNYHWLISEIFEIQGMWIKEFCDDENFSIESTYIDFFPFSLSLSYNELYKAFKTRKVSAKFIAAQLHYHLFSVYFSRNTKKEICSGIENYIISKIPDELIYDTINFTLNESFALTYLGFYNQKFDRTKSHEKEKLFRIRQILDENNKLFHCN